MILTVDFGTSVTKVALWGDDGLVTLARAAVATTHPEPGWAEQDPSAWWTSLVVGCAEARAQAPAAFAGVHVLACSGARQTFAPVTATGDPVGRGLVWSDRRAAAEAEGLAAALGGREAVHRRTGVPLDAGAVAAKLAWLGAHEPDRLARAAWVLTPRDLVVWRLTGEVVTDTTMASRSGLYDLEGAVVPDLAGAALDKLAAVGPADAVAGLLRAVPAAELGLAPGIPVVVGAGDRACEVLGSGAGAGRPMVSWGTTANVSAPVPAAPGAAPGLVLSRGATGGWLLEGGLSAAGSLLAWLGRLTGTEPGELVARAAASPPGARGVVVLPWLDGARAPWWCDGARAAVVGLSSAHDAGDLARAVVESVAREVARCLAALADLDGRATALALGGAGTSLDLWVEVLTATTGLPATRRRSGEAASAGAALLAARALGEGRDLDALDPPAATVGPDPAAADRYRELGPAAERAAAAVLSLAGP